MEDYDSTDQTTRHLSRARCKAKHVDSSSAEQLYMLFPEFFAVSKGSRPLLCIGEERCMGSNHSLLSPRSKKGDVHAHCVGYFEGS
eukprot:1159699-Pelagomonas_calceolata.AAC.3